MMTQQEQRIALADLAGWTNIKQGTAYLWGTTPDGIVSMVVTDFLHDLNAVHELEMKRGLPDMEYKDKLWWICEHDWQHAKARTHRDPIFATASQRCEALCRVLFPERWKEGV